MSTQYKLRHKPTGLFYGPKKSRNGIASNLSEDGAVYNRPPTINERPWFRDLRGQKVATKEHEWEAVEFWPKPAARKAKPTKKPAARPIPPPPPGWEIVAKDDPRLDCLPCRPMCLHRVVGWIPDPISEVGKVIDPHSRAVFTFALPVAQPPSPQPPMIRLRLPSEKPTREDGDKDGYVLVFWDNGQTTLRLWSIGFESAIIAWLPGRLPKGILPREPSRKERLRAEFENQFDKQSLNFTRIPNGEYAHGDTRLVWIGFLAAKRGGAE